MHLKRIWPILTLLVSLSSFANEKVFTSDAILGHWLSEKKDGIIHIKKIAGDYKGYLVWIKDIAEGKKKDILDTKNPNKKLQKKKLAGHYTF